MLPATSSLPSSSAIHAGTADCNDNMSDSKDVENYNEGIYGLSFGDDDLDMNRTDCGENIGKNNSDCVKQGNGLSDFEFDDDVEYDHSTNPSTIQQGDGLLNFESDGDVEYDPSTHHSSNTEGSVGESAARGLDRVTANVFLEASHRRSI
ncbi:hypothetical protein F0562_001729 [Nyssa sinensis]|uniref:Uncharacterized protein n=1 Tax=Nyssa sinensis TaxID=561372 RepID=A0A5J5C3V9_9ASTE|nr:hypothetical protein F0562_001729 [Nyssa sinensis]